MDASAALCNDGSFGPTVRHCRGGFDFTLLFEQSFLSIAPSSLFILLSAVRLVVLLSKGSRLVAGARLQRAKLAVIAVYGALLVALLVEWARRGAYGTRASLPAAILSLVNVFVLAALSWVEHAYSPRPSALINVYLLFSILFDAVQIRTLWLKDIGTTLPGLFSAALAIKIAVLALESIPKGRYLSQEWSEKSPEEKSGVFSKSLLLWLRHILINGHKRLLVPDDLYALDTELETKRLSDAFGRAWSSSAGKGASSPTTVWVVARTLKWPLLAPAVPRLVQVAFTICQSLLLREFLRYLQGEESFVAGTGYGFIGAYGLVYCGIAVSTCYYWRLTYKCLVKLRGCIVAAIYKKTTEIDTALYDMSAPVALMSTDMERILQGCKDFHEIWANAVQVAISIWLLYENLGVACVAPAVVALLSTTGSVLMSSYADKAQAKWMEATQARVGATAKAISSMSIVRLLGLADYMQAMLTDLRTAELHAARYFRVVEVLTATVSFAPLLLSPVFTFMVFVIQAKSSGTKLDTTKIFTALSLLQLMTQPLVWLFQAMPLFVASLGCLTRVGNYLNAQPRVEKRVFGSPPGSASHSLTDPGFGYELQDKHAGTGNDAIRIRDGQFGWIDTKLVLQNVNIDVPRGKLTMMVGPVASGKTSLCKAIIGELPFATGTVQLNIAGREVAYCNQSTFLMNGTLQQNILGFSTFDSVWYDAVVRAVDLMKDISLLPEGSQTQIGSKGAVLSGGQRQRVAIARALYARTPLAVFDDVLSGLDAVTKQHVFRNVFSSQGILQQNGRTVILCTHDVDLMPHADHVIALGGGAVESGTYSHLSMSSEYIKSLGVREQLGVSLDEPHHHEDDVLELSFDDEVAGPEAQEDMTRRLGDASIYKYLFGHIGLWRTLLFAFFQCGWAVCSTIGPVWLKFWASANASGKNNDAYYLGVYAAFQGLALLFLALFAGQTLTSIAVKCGASLHRVLLNTVVAAPMTFFTTVDAGVTTNRFSQDILLIDGELPMALLETVSAGLVALVQAILIAIAAPFVAVMYPFLAALLYFVQSFYLRTSRQLRFLDLEAKSPLYTHFLETLHGLSTIRSFGWSTDNKEWNLKLVDRSQQPVYLLYMVQRWLQLVLELLIAVIAIALITVAVKLQSTSVPFIGVALVNLMSIGQELKMTVINWTMLETSLSAIARTKSFEERTPSENKPNEIEQPPVTWPQSGEVQLNAMSASYETGEGAGLVLKNVSMHIRGGEKIAVCGRSGSGKSSLVMALAKMMDLASGSITIDGLDLSTIPRSTVRAALNVIPQEAYFFHKTISQNLDPSGAASASEMRSALEQVQLLDVVETSGGLGSELDIETLSQGQKQLLALARAVLRPGKIVILDEATSNVDKHVADVMQRTIREQFKGRTVIAVAHQLNTILDFDRVMVMDSGQLIETGSPKDLLAREGLFKRLCEAQGVGM